MERHRGPDGSGHWESSGQEVVFGHRRLAIIDLSPAGAQPMLDPDTGCCVTFNGEIYNFQEIRQDLAARGETFRSSSDTEIILKAYKQWGIDAVARFRGIFALGLWDPRSRAVHLVRDQMGIKPLYWTLVDDPETGEEVLLFASEVRALLGTGAVARRLDPAAVASYVWNGFVVGPGTALAGVHLLPAASVLTVEPSPDGRSPNRRAQRRYWELPSSSVPARTVEDLREELKKTVRMQLIADVPLGVFLSGGVDSSAVAALATEVAPDAVHTFTIAFDVPEYDEARYALQVAEQIKSRHRAVTLTQQTFLDQLDDAFTAIDQPTFDAINTYFVSRAAREAGMTVALAGTGGDELFGGYPSYVDLPRARRLAGYLPLNGGIAGRAVGGAIGALSRLGNAVSWDLLRMAPPQTRWGKIADVARAAHDVLGLYQVSYSLFTREAQAALCARPVREAQSAQQYGLPAPVAEAWRARIAGSELLHAVSLLELSSFVGERLLRDTDTASMAVALEVRVPLLDHVLVETVAGIEPVRRFAPARKKQLLRDAALGRLDPAIFDRPKSGFVLPIDVWARQKLEGKMSAVFADEALVRRAGLDPRSVATLWRSFTARRPGLYWSRVWALYVLLSWCETHDVGLAA
ncbi:MAG: asparagine synthase (glutamine-hydrolyzing) [Candidatus Rokuibacteriota bacterium]